MSDILAVVDEAINAIAGELATTRAGHRDRKDALTAIYWKVGDLSQALASYVIAPPVPEITSEPLPIAATVEALDAPSEIPA